MYLFFDTETTGLPRNWNAPVTDVNNWPRMVQIAWILADKSGNLTNKVSHIIKPDGFAIPPSAAQIHRIDTQRAIDEGLPIPQVLSDFTKDLQKADYLVAHNISFDLSVLAAEFLRIRLTVDNLLSKVAICTKVESTSYCGLPENKWPTLEELYQVLFKEPLKDSHDAMVDVNACHKCFLELKRLGVISLSTPKTPV